MRSLSALLYDVSVRQIVGPQDVQVHAISCDTRKISPGSLFVAIRGTQVDGHDYIDEAIEAGSHVIVCERLPKVQVAAVTYVVVLHSPEALGKLAAHFYDDAATRLKIVAVTGTSGKTTTVHLLYGLFKQLGYRVGMLSTICNQIDGQTLPANLTTPDAVRLHQLLALMVDRGCEYCFMEASSHGIVQSRLAGLHLAGAVFLNISHEHLDYHQTFDAYIQAKQHLFDTLPVGAFALYNADDRRGPIMVQNTAAATHSFAMKSMADFKAQWVADTWEGIGLRIAHRTVYFQLAGAFNAYNLLAAYGVGYLLGQDRDALLLGLSSLRPAPGRFQHIRTPHHVNIVIDYAHKPAALESILTAIHKSKPRQGRVITVVGCGGNRDQAKRPIMAQIAYQASDQLILTTDNPRDEAPETILSAMQAGLTTTEQKNTLSILDRAVAIQTAYCLAKAHDTVLIAGKGHETFQEVRGVRHPFSDEATVRALIAE